jgi:hypothetical protein
MKTTPRYPILSSPTLPRQGSLTPLEIVSELRRLSFVEGTDRHVGVSKLLEMVKDPEYPYLSILNSSKFGVIWTKLVEEANVLRKRHPNDPTVKNSLERNYYVSQEYPTKNEAIWIQLRRRLQELLQGLIYFPHNNTREIIETFRKEHGLDTLG